MSRGTTSLFTYTYPRPRMTGAQFIPVAEQALEMLGWAYQRGEDDSLLASTGEDAYYPEAEIRIIPGDGFAQLLSSLRLPETEGREWAREHIDRLVNVLQQVSVDAVMAIPPEEIIWRQATARPQTPSRGEHADILAVFKPSGSYFVTPILLNINLLVFALMSLSGLHMLEPDGPGLINWGANYGPRTLDGEWWRLLTGCFLHIGIFHLIMNMYALVFIGLLLEPHLGRGRFIGAYLATGLAASMVSLSWHSGAISAGASGAIFGMYGVFLALLTTSLIERRTRKIQLMSIAIFVAYNLVAGLKGNTDNAAHIGGLISGILIGYALIPGLKKRSRPDGVAS